MYQRLVNIYTFNCPNVGLTPLAQREMRFPIEY
jgi:hypothetical protein